MNNLSDALSIAIGLVLVYLLLSIVISYILEVIDSLFQVRSNDLVNAIQRLLDPSSPELSGVSKLKENWSRSLDIWNSDATKQTEGIFQRIVVWWKSRVKPESVVPAVVGISAAEIQAAVAKLADTKQMAGDILPESVNEAVVDLANAIKKAGGKPTHVIQREVDKLVDLIQAILSDQTDIAQMAVGEQTNALQGAVEALKGVITYAGGKQTYALQVALNNLEESIKKDVIKRAVTAQLNQNIVKAFYAHPIIKTLSLPKKLPSYIQPEDFTNALFDLLTKAGVPGEVTDPNKFLDAVKAGIGEIKDPSLRGTLLPLIESAQVMEADKEKSIALARKNVEDWFNTTMDRAKGWYKRKTLIIAIVVGILISGLFNADTLVIFQSLWKDISVRQSMSDAAVAYIQQGNNKSATDALDKLNSLNIPLGWDGLPADRDPNTPNNPQDFPVLPWEIFLKVLGLLITGFAISQGSSIWFETLTKLINLRSTGEKPSDKNNSVITPS